MLFSISSMSNTLQNGCRAKGREQRETLLNFLSGCFCSCNRFLITLFSHFRISELDFLRSTSLDKDDVCVNITHGPFTSKHLRLICQLQGRVCRKDAKVKVASLELPSVMSNILRGSFLQDFNESAVTDMNKSLMPQQLVFRSTFSTHR